MFIKYSFRDCIVYHSTDTFMFFATQINLINGSRERIPRSVWLHEKPYHTDTPLQSNASYGKLNC